LAKSKKGRKNQTECRLGTKKRKRMERPEPDKKGEEIGHRVRPRKKKTWQEVEMLRRKTKKRQTGKLGFWHSQTSLEFQKAQKTPKLGSKA